MRSFLLAWPLSRCCSYDVMPVVGDVKKRRQKSISSEPYDNHLKQIHDQRLISAKNDETRNSSIEKSNSEKTFNTFVVVYSLRSWSRFRLNFYRHTKKCREEEKRLASVDDLLDVRMTLSSRKNIVYMARKSIKKLRTERIITVFSRRAINRTSSSQ